MNAVIVAVALASLVIVLQALKAPKVQRVLVPVTRKPRKRKP